MSLTDQGSTRNSQIQSKRLRVSRACDRCKKRKIRCTGTHPCESCTRDGTSCIYAAPYNRGRRQDLATSEFTQLPATRASHGEADGDSSTHGMSGQQPLPQPSAPPNVTVPRTTNGDVSRPASPELITDLQGHYVGPAAGLSFLARVRKRLHYGDHASPHFTFGDAPLPDWEVIPSVMISVDEASRLVDKFFNFTIPIDRFLDRQTIEEWVQEFCETMGHMKESETAPARRAIIWIIFAMAQEHMTANGDSPGDDKAVRYFLAAEYHLSKERGRVSLASIQARLYQCFWLLSRSRVNHCWALFGSAARMALTLGLHRKWSTRTNGGGSKAEQDGCRGTFWSAYCLDTHLSLTLGRPKIFHDDDIDQDLPSDDDTNLSPTSLGCSVMVAPVAYYRLHRILALILRDLYSIRPISTTDQCDLSHKYLQHLKAWRKEIPSFLQLNSAGDPPLIPIFQRQRQVLNFTYWHAIIVTTRPLLLKNFTYSRQAQDHAAAGAEGHRCSIDEYIRECLKAAMSIIEQVGRMFESGRMFRSFWATFYFGFSATAVLYVYTIQNASSAETYQTYFEAATRSQDNLSKFIENGSLIGRYCIMLEELRLEAIRQIESGVSPVVAVDQGSASMIAQLNAVAAEYANILGAPVPYPTACDLDFVSAPADITTWMQFDPSSVRNFSHFGNMTRDI